MGHYSRQEFVTSQRASRSVISLDDWGMIGECNYFLLVYSELNGKNIVVSEMES